MIDQAPPWRPPKVVPAMLMLAGRRRGRLTTFALRLGSLLLVICAVLSPAREPGPAPPVEVEARERELPARERDRRCVRPLHRPREGRDNRQDRYHGGRAAVPVQRRTTLRCAPHVYVFSDMAQKVGDVEIFDALDETADEVKDGNTDFDIYRKQQELEDPEEIVAQLRTVMSPPGSIDLAAWTLDKYKNLHIIEKSWALKPDMDWYLHIDADTYVVWPSLIQWFRRLDKNRDLFLGSGCFFDDDPFAHGGSGILLSGEAMRTLAADHNGTAARWDPEVRNHCCGDFVLTMALKEYDIGPVMHSWPTINGESQNTIPFGDEHWCQPVVTLHHVSVDGMEEMARFEDRRPSKSVRRMHPLLTITHNTG